MIEVSSAQLQLWLTSFFWPFCRVLAYLMSDPILGHKNVSSQVKGRPGDAAGFLAGAQFAGAAGGVAVFLGRPWGDGGAGADRHVAGAW
ncbi:MAG: hypothetical protein LKM38_10130 [Pseudomonas veronii]|nr:hypothetical protein [Pseudomonas veronii]